MTAVEAEDLRRRLRSSHRTVALSAARKLLTAVASNKADATYRDLLFQSIASSQTSILVASACVQGVPRLVASGSYPWDDAVNALDGLVRTLEGPRVEVVVKVIGDLLLLRVASDDEETSAMARRCIFGGQHSSRPHPYFTVAKNAELWPCLLSEIDRLLQANKTAVSVELILGSFFEHILVACDAGITGQSIWLKEISEVILRHASGGQEHSTGGELATYLFDIVWKALRRLPPTQNGEGESWCFLLAESLTRTVLQCSANQHISSPLAPYVSRLSLTILCLACDTRDRGGSVIRYLGMLDHLYTTTLLPEGGVEKSRLAGRYTQTEQQSVIVGVSYILWTSFSSDEEKKALILLEKLLGDVPTRQMKGYYAAIAIFPLIQIIADGGDNCILAAHILQRAERASKEQSEFQAPPTGLCGTFALLSTTAAAVSLSFSQFATRKQLPSGILANYRQFFQIPFLVHPLESARISALRKLLPTQNSAKERCGTLSLLPVLLRIIRHDPSPRVRFAILMEGFPTIGEIDAVAGGKVASITAALAKYRVSSLAVTGLRSLYLIWRKQPRCWHALRGLLAEWVRQRKIRDVANDYKKPNQINMKEAEVEIAVLSTIRDICIEKALDHGGELIPMLASSLQGIRLTKAGRHIALQAVNACIAGGAMEPRSAWNVFFVYAADAAFAGDGDFSLAQALCDFCILAAKKKDVSDIYTEFRRSLAADCLAPHCLTPRETTTSTDWQISNAALVALSHFPPEDILPLLPSRARDIMELALHEWSLQNETSLTSIAPTSHQPNGWSSLLTQLISHEVEHLRRSLFKPSQQSSSSNGNPPTASSRTSTAGKPKSRAIQAAESLRKAWKTDRLAPGLRLGCAIASLFAPDNTASRSASAADFKRNTIAYLTDVRPTLAQFCLRTVAIRGWKAMFTRSFCERSESNNTPRDLERAIDDVEKELLSRLEKLSGDPAVGAAVAMALAGFIMALRAIGDPSVANRSARCLSSLMRNPSPPALTSSEAKSTSLLAVGIIAAGEDDAGQYTKILENMLLNEKNAHLRSGAALGLGCVVAESDFAGSENVKMDAVHSLSNILFGDEDTEEFIGSSHVRLAAGLALSSILKQPENGGELSAKKQAVFTQSIQILRAFSKLKPDELAETRESYEIGMIAGLARCVGELADSNDETHKASELLQQVRNLVSTSAANFAQHEFHFAVARARLLYRLEPSLVASEIRIELKTCNDPAYTSYTRSAAALALSALLGTDPLNPTGDGVNDAKTGHRTSELIALNAKTVAVLLKIAGFDSETGDVLDVLPDPTVARRAAVALGLLAANEDAIESGASLNATEMSTAGEPRDFSRLPSASSFLRATFEALGSNTGHGTSQPSSQVTEHILNALADVKYPLPPVYWTPVLSNLPILPSLRFASLQSTVTQSCASFLIANLLQPPLQREARLFLWSEGCLGKVLSLAGLRAPRGTQELVTRRGEAGRSTVSLGGKRVTEVVKKAEVYLFFAENSFVSDDERLTFLQTISYRVVRDQEEVSISHDAAAVEELRSSLQSICRRLLSFIPPPRTQSSESLLRLATIGAYAQSSIETEKELLVESQKSVDCVAGDKYIRKALIVSVLAPTLSDKLLSHRLISSALRSTLQALAPLGEWLDLLGPKGLCWLISASLTSKSDSGPNDLLADLMKILDVMLVVASGYTEGGATGVSWCIGGACAQLWGGLREPVLDIGEGEVVDEASKQVQQESGMEVELDVQQQRLLAVMAHLLPRAIFACSNASLQKQVIRRLIKIMQLLQTGERGHEHQKQSVIVKQALRSLAEVLAKVRLLVGTEGSEIDYARLLIL